MITVRGKCRHCDSSCAHDGVGWAAERWPIPEAWSCAVAPPVECPPCSGLGTLPDPTPAERDRRRPCENCAGLGEVAGPHWPWRHPSPT